MSIWILNQRVDSSYDDIEGQAYSYPKYLANAQRVEPGDLFVYYRPKRGNDIGGGFYRAGRVQSLAREREMIKAHLADYVQLSRVVPEPELTSSPRSNQQNSINRLSVGLFFEILRSGGLTPQPRP